MLAIVFDGTYEMATLSRKHDLSVCCVNVTLTSILNSEFSKIRGTASFAYTVTQDAVFIAITRISQTKSTTKMAGKARNLQVYLLCRLHVALA